MNFLSWVDLELQVPQQLQLDHISSYLGKSGHRVVFYGGDDILVHKKLPGLIAKIERPLKNFNGVCFFSLSQVLRCKEPMLIVERLFSKVDALAFSLQGLMITLDNRNELESLVNLHRFAMSTSSAELKLYRKI
ncbi:hypothetical protein MCEMSEM52_00550 [Burkholderiales bacterium]